MGQKRIDDEMGSGARDETTRPNVGDGKHRPPTTQIIRVDERRPPRASLKNKKR
jgi:hypothetical protein